MKFCEKLRQLIDERDLTQKHVALNLHIAVSTMGGYVQGTSEPDFETLKQIAEYFEVSTDYLLNVNNSVTKSEYEDELIHTFRSLSDDQKIIILEQTKAIAKLNFKGNANSSNSHKNKKLS